MRVWHARRGSTFQVRTTFRVDVTKAAGLHSNERIRPKAGRTSNQNLNTMKTRSALNSAAFALVVCGLLLKAGYMPGANISLILSAALMLGTLFAFALKDNTEAGVPMGSNRLLVGTLALLILGAMFRIMHWPGGPVLSVVAYLAAFALPLVLVVQQRAFAVSKQYLVTLFTFLVLILGVLPHNPIARYIGRGWDHPLNGPLEAHEGDGQVEVNVR